MNLFYPVWYRWIDRELSRPFTPPDCESDPKDWTAIIGATGERIAAKHLRRTGCKVLYRNYRPPTGGGEVDLVYRDGKILVFGEVKTRTSGEFGDPSRNVDQAKEKLIIRGANSWLRELNYPELIFRFDVIEVLLKEGLPPQVNVIENAFTTPQRGLAL